MTQNNGPTWDERLFASRRAYHHSGSQEPIPPSPAGWSDISDSSGHFSKKKIFSRLLKTSEPGDFGIGWYFLEDIHHFNFRRNPGTVTEFATFTLISPGW